jgi:tight adherence protein B
MSGSSSPIARTDVTRRLRAAIVRLLPGRARRRRRRLEAAVPEVLDVLRATMAAGAAPHRALRAAAEVGPPPLQRLLVEAACAADLGAGAGQALAAAGRKEALPELVLAGEALDLAEATGAPPVRVLAGVAAAANDRLRASQATLAATAQARLSARVVAAMAPAFLALLALLSPADVAFLIRGRSGWVTLATATVFEVLGMWWASRIVRGNR